MMHAFLDGMNDAEPQVIRFIDVIGRHFEYCTGCFTCKQNSGTCIYNGDMRKIPDAKDQKELLRKEKSASRNYHMNPKDATKRSPRV